MDARYEKVRRGGAVVGQGVPVVCGMDVCGMDECGYREAPGPGWVAEPEASWGAREQTIIDALPHITSRNAAAWFRLCNYRV